VNPVLVADVGATNTRLALTAGDGKLRAIHAVANESVSGLDGLLAEALAGAGKPRPEAAVLGIAGPIDSDRVVVINRGWSFSRRALARKLGLKQLVVVNDFEALTHSLPVLKPADLAPVGIPRKMPKDRLFVCGPGTGFGSSLLLTGGAKPQVLGSEAGHMRIGAVDPAEARVIGRFTRDTGPVIVEQILSGSGLARLHEFLSRQKVSSEDVVQGARAGDAAARATVEFFLRVFGRIAGDLTLAYNAKAVFLAGGVSQGLAPLIPNSPFRDAFEEHHPYRERMALIPIRVIVHDFPGLLGAAQMARHLT
jgi:glucokinase